MTSLAARTFPPQRRADGRVVRDCAREAIDAGSPGTLMRESLSLAGAGLRVRLGVNAREVWQAPWRPALAALVLPLAAALLCVWTFGFVPRYDHWPPGEGWALLLGGSLLAVVGAAFAARWVVVLGACAVFVAAASPHFGYGTETALSDTPSFFQASGVDLGASSLIPTLLLAAAALSLPRKRERSTNVVLDRLVLGLLPTAVALVHLLPRERPERTIVVSYEDPPRRGVLGEPTVSFGDPYAFPWLTASHTLLAALGIALLVAAVFSWRAARRHPELALATALVLASVAYPVAWVMHGYRIWPTIVVPLGAALALMLRAAHAARRSPHAAPAARSR